MCNGRNSAGLPRLVPGANIEGGAEQKGRLCGQRHVVLDIPEKLPGTEPGQNQVRAAPLRMAIAPDYVHVSWPKAKVYLRSLDASVQIVVLPDISRSSLTAIVDNIQSIQVPESEQHRLKLITGGIPAACLALAPLGDDAAALSMWLRSDPIFRGPLHRRVRKWCLRDRGDVDHC